MPRGIAQVLDSRRDAGAAAQLCPPRPTHLLAVPLAVPLWGHSSSQGRLQKHQTAIFQPKNPAPSSWGQLPHSSPQPHKALIPSYSRQEGPAPRSPGTHPPLNHSDLASPSPSPRACKTRGGGCEHLAPGPKRMGLYNIFERLSRVRGGQTAPKARWRSWVGTAAPCRTAAFGEWEQHSEAQQSWSRGRWQERGCVQGPPGNF